MTFRLWLFPTDLIALKRVWPVFRPGKIYNQHVYTSSNSWLEYQSTKKDSRFLPQASHPTSVSLRVCAEIRFWPSKHVRCACGVRAPIMFRDRLFSRWKRSYLKLLWRMGAFKPKALIFCFPLKWPSVLLLGPKRIITLR